MVCPTLCTESEVCVISRKGFNPKNWISDSVKKVSDCVAKTTNKIVDIAKNKFAIRRLTPRECWRLMSFGHKNEDGTWDDTDFEKAQSVCSDTQLYKQAGNSICECVLKAIFNEMLP